ncbi:hypothetical protein [Streptomyces sp. NPDC048419]|uniref:hypothetical protein n=1 Tax=Streptomyces sp. NPDC048419 TaxID=3365547 RepID=UPI0037163829
MTEPTTRPTEPACEPPEATAMYQFLVCRNEVYADVDAFYTHANGACFAAVFAEASAYAEGPTWLMRGNVVGDNAAATTP